MGQQETMWATVSALRHLILTLLVAALSAAMMAVSAVRHSQQVKLILLARAAKRLTAHLSVKRTISSSRTLAARLGPP